GKMKTDERFVASTVTTMTGGWVKLTPAEPLATGEYALIEMLEKEAMNLYVWDFGVNPAAPANAGTWKPDATDAQPKTDQPADLKKREKQEATNCLGGSRVQMGWSFPSRRQTGSCRVVARM